MDRRTNRGGSGRWRRGTLVLVVVLASSAAGGGCAGTARDIVEEATPGGVDGAIQALAKPDNQQALSGVLGGPVVESAGRGLTRGVIGGAVDTFAGTTRPSAASAGPGTRPAGVAGAAGDIGQDLAPALESLVRRAVAAGMDEAFGPPRREASRKAARDIASTITEASVEGVATGVNEQLGPGVRSLLTEQIGPGLGDVVRQHVGPAVADVVRDEVAPALREAVARQANELGPAIDGAAGDRLERVAGETSRVVSREVVLGLQDGLREAGVLDANGRATGFGPLGQARDAVSTGLNLATVLAIALGLAVVALGLVLWITLSRTRRARAEAEQREAGARRLAEAVRAAEARPWGGELRELLRQELGREFDGGAIRREHERAAP
jgi:hypothetical protein